MALFPKARFEVLLPNGTITAGGSTRGVLVVTAEEAIPRANHVDLELVSTARMRHPVEVDHVVFRTRKRVAFPAGVKVGTYRFPFVLETPPSLPPSFSDALADIHHAVRVRMDVDWAGDPEITIHPRVTMPPREGHREPLREHMPPEFHAHALIEVSLDSTVIVEGDPIVGAIQLVRGTIQPFDGIQLNLVRSVVSGLAGSWMNIRASVMVMAPALASGEPVPFELPGSTAPTFRTGTLHHAVRLAVMPIGDFAALVDGRYQFPLEILPLGSVVHGDPGGSSRLRQRSARIAAETGLREGRGSLLVEGEPAGIRLHVRDVTQQGIPSIDVELDYPDLGLGLSLREDRVHAARPVPQGFADALLPSVQPGVSVRLSDHQLGFRYRLADDGVVRLIEETRRAIRHAERVANAIHALPFPEGIAPDPWRSLAEATGAFLVPSVPSLSGIAFHRITATQDERRLLGTIQTVWKDGIPRERVFLYLVGAPLPEKAILPLANGIFPEALAALRDTFSILRVTSNGGVLTLEGSAASADPGALVPALESVVDWVLRERGEEPSGSPYR